MSSQSKNKLQRETPFVARIKFRNDLPELPCDPFLLVDRFDPEKLAEFKLTSIETALRPDLCPPGEDVLPIIDIQRYWASTDRKPDLHPEDRALIDGGRGPQASARVSWLMRTEYMQGRDGPVAAPRPKPRAPTATPRLTLEGAKAAIEASFEAAKKAPVHPSKPNLTAVEVMPVLPDMAFWPHEHVTVSSTTDIITTVDEPELGAKERLRLAGRALYKAYHMPELEDGRQRNITRFLALLTPQEVEGLDDDLAGEGGYEWKREFAFSTKSEMDGSKAYSLRLTPDGAFYVPITSNYALLKRKRSDFAHVPIPKRIDVGRREPTAEESQVQDGRMAKLYGLSVGNNA